MDQQQLIEKMKSDLQLHGYSKGTIINYSEMIRLFKETLSDDFTEQVKYVLLKYMQILTKQMSLVI